MGQQRLVVNALFTATPGTDDRLALTLHTQARQALGTMPEQLAGLPRSTVGLRKTSPVGISQLCRLAGYRPTWLAAVSPPEPGCSTKAWPPPPPPTRR